MKLDIVDVKIERFKGKLFIFVYFEGGVERFFSLSDSHYSGSFSDGIYAETVDSFLARRNLKWYSCPTESDSVSIDLPTFCGYLSRTGRWLRTGPFHCKVVLDLPKFLGNLY